MRARLYVVPTCASEAYEDRHGDLSFFCKGYRPRQRIEAERRGAKVVLVGDPEQQLQAIEAGAAFRSLTERSPHVEITEIHRQRAAWQQKATWEFATGRTSDALDAYREHGMIHAAETREEARANLIEGWDQDRNGAPGKASIILTHTNDEVRVFNALARAKLRECGELGEDMSIQVERGTRDFATGDRVIFLRNERGLTIKNGSLGTLDRVDSQSMQVQLDSGRTIAFELKDYAHFDHGYAATIHKAQGVTVDRVHVLATPGLGKLKVSCGSFRVALTSLRLSGNADLRSWLRLATGTRSTASPSRARINLG